MTVAQPTALTTLLSLFANGEREDRLALARLQGKCRILYSDALEASGRLLSSGTESFRAQATLLALSRMIWSLVPARLLDSPSPDFESLAHRALVERLGAFDGVEASARYLSIVFKRIKKYAHYGRRSTSLDLDTITHKRLLLAQNGRCNHCLYEFGSDHYIYAAEDDGVLSRPYAPKIGEVHLEHTYRKPELDHIIPLVLGGDSEENWQILCKSCNAGKSDQFSYIFLLSGHASNRLSHLFELTAGKRYAIIAETIAKGESPNICPGDGGFYRVFKVCEQGMANPENLLARYT